MKFHTTWSFRPYAELFNASRAAYPYVCRLTHKTNDFTVDFTDNSAPEAHHTIMWRKRDMGDFHEIPITGSTVTVDGLDTDTDYEFYIVRTDEPDARSETRLVRTGFVPGTVINYLHPEDTAYSFSGTALDSPSLVKLPSGRLISSMGIHKAPNFGENLTLLYYSDDGGESWYYLCELFPCEWGKLFWDGGRLYCLAVSRPYGDLIIGCSEDEGATWCMPTVLLRGSSVNYKGGCHRSPNPIFRHKGRIITDLQCGGWHVGIFLNAVLSAAEGSDLLDVNNWAITEWWDHRNTEIAPIMNGGMTGDSNVFTHTIGGIEGSPVATKDGKVMMIYRFGDKKPLILDYDYKNPFGELTNPRLADLAVKDAKAPIQYDEVSGRYYMMCNYAPPGTNPGRSICALMWTEDFEAWSEPMIIMDFSDRDTKLFGIQYFDFLFDGDDIVFLCRTACSGAASFHDSNHQTFHRIKNFRERG